MLCITDEVANYLITVPVYWSKSEEAGDTLTDNVISKDCLQDHIIKDENSAFMLSLMTYLLKKFDKKKLKP